MMQMHPGLFLTFALTLFAPYVGAQSLYWDANWTFTEATGGVSSGIGTDTLDWGVPFTVTSQLRALGVSVSQDTLPKSWACGLIEFRNGTILGDTGISSGRLRVSLTQCARLDGGCRIITSGYEDPDLRRDVSFTAINTANGNPNPNDDNDGVLLPAYDISMWVAEDSSATFAAICNKRSPLDIVDIVYVAGDGFVGVRNIPEPRVEAVVRVKPADGGPITLQSSGVTPIAILTDSTLDAAIVDVGTVEAGPGLAKPTRATYEDVDADGDIDLLMKFETSSLGLTCGDALLIVRGRTANDRDFRGSQDIRVIASGCKS